MIGDGVFTDFVADAVFSRIGTFLVFFAIALQCVSTVAIMAREANSWKLAQRMMIAHLCLAWVASWATFNVTGFLA